MAIEIERKFLVHADRLPPLEHGLHIEQAYVPTSNGTTVRVRVAGEQAFIGIKTRKTQLSRLEYEFPVPVDDAREMLALVCTTGHIMKRRYLIPQGELTWEIDVFGAENEGLIVAELELPLEDQSFELPDWIDREVTLDPRYSNYNLSQSPYRRW